MSVESRLGSAVEVAGGPRLDDAQRARFWRDGFLSVDGLLEPAELEALEAPLASLLARPEPAADGMRFDYLGGGGLTQLLLPFDYAPELFESAFFAKAARVARDLVGAPLRYRGSHYMEKPGGGGAATPWHQDEAFWEPAHRHEAVAIWLPLDGVAEGGGCMRFAAGSHREDALLAHRRVGGDDAVHGLELVEAIGDVGSIARCPLRPGGVTVHHCRTAHAAEANTLAHARRALVVNFEVAPVPLAEPRSVPWQRAKDEAAARRKAEGIELP